MDYLYGLLSLRQTQDEPDVLMSPIQAKGCHVKAPVDYPAGYFQLSTNAALNRVFVPSREETLDAIVLGGLHADQDASKTAARQMLAMNVSSSELRLADLVHERMLTSLVGHYACCVSQTSDHSKFVLLSRGIPLYFTGVTSETEDYLVWTNDATLVDNLRAHHGQRFYYYRMQTLLNGSLAIQTQFVLTKFGRWRQALKDKLGIYAALEHQVFKNHRGLTTVVNKSAGDNFQPGDNSCR